MHFPFDDWRPSIVVLWFVPFGEGPRFFNFPDLDAVLFDDFGGLQLKVHKEKRSQHVFQRCVTSRPKCLYNTVWRILSSLTLFQMCKIRLLHRCRVRESPCVINRFRLCVFLLLSCLSLIQNDKDKCQLSRAINYSHRQLSWNASFKEDERKCRNQ